MNPDRQMGEQPIAQLMAQLGLKPHDLVAASERPITHKMIARACKGRWLTDNTKNIVLCALQRATGRTYTLSELFTY